MRLRAIGYGLAVALALGSAGSALAVPARRSGGPEAAAGEARVAERRLPARVRRDLAVLRARWRRRAFAADWRRLARRYPAPGDRDFIVVDIARERLDLFRDGRYRAGWRVSTSRFGVGQRRGSDRTPVGVFRVVGELGRGGPADQVLNAAGPTGRFAKPVLAPGHLAASRLIVGRILLLEGLQPGWNQGGDVDTLARDIFIHGTANVGMLGRPASRGCVQMAPGAVIRLARMILPGALVMITRGVGGLRRIPGPGTGPDNLDFSEIAKK